MNLYRIIKVARVVNRNKNVNTDICSLRRGQGFTSYGLKQLFKYLLANFMWVVFKFLVIT